jgi:Conserved hypothetical protein (DUF2461)
MVGRACLTRSLERGGEGLFTNDLFMFLEDLKRHNDRAWFAENKERYVEAVQEPALEFVRAFTPSLAKISPQFVADGRPVGGSLSRIYRDVRFGKDKSPYKTHVVISFRHRLGKDVRRPATTSIWGRARSSPRRGSGTRTARPCVGSGRPSSKSRGTGTGQ